MKSSYKDSTLALRERRFGSLDPGREVGALVNLFAKDPVKIPWQSRALLEKLLTLIRARRLKRTSLVFADTGSELELPALCFVYERTIGQRLSIVLLNEYKFKDPETEVWADLWSTISSKVERASLSDYLRQDYSDEIFHIYVLAAEALDKQEQVLASFSDGQFGVMFVKDFSLKRTKFIAETYRRTGLSITESADGFGECWSL
jgi:hypothetical protein